MSESTTKFELRYRWFALAYFRLVVLLARVKINPPIRLSRWVCEHSAEYRFWGGKWQPIHTDLSGEDWS